VLDFGSEVVVKGVETTVVARVGSDNRARILLSPAEVETTGADDNTGRLPIDLIDASTA